MSDELKLVFLGTGASLPTPRRGLPTMAIVREGTIYLLDCAEGTQMRLVQAGLSPTKIRYIFISHLHGDHIFGLPGYLTSQQMLDRKSPLLIIAPRGIKKLLDTIQAVSGYRLDYQLDIIELQEKEHHVQAGAFQITAALLDHRAPCYGYRFSEQEKPGKFNLKKAEEFGIPVGPLRSQLQQGKSVQLPDGRRVHPQDILGPPRPGRIITYCTDTRPCQAGIELAQNSDILIHDSTFMDSQEDRAQETYHSMARQAATIARQAGVRQLVLWHLSARINENDESTLLNEAREVFPNSLLPSDFQTIELPRRE